MTEEQKQTLEELLKLKKAEERKEREAEQRKFKDLCRKHFGKTPTEIQELINRVDSPAEPTRCTLDSKDEARLRFADRIVSHYGLRTATDLQQWQSVMLNDRSREYWTKQRQQATTSVDPIQGDV